MMTFQVYGKIKHVPNHQPVSAFEMVRSPVGEWNICRNQWKAYEESVEIETESRRKFFLNLWKVFLNLWKLWEKYLRGVCENL